MKNKITDLRNHLFATLEALQDKDDPMPVERAQAIANVGKVIVDSAKVEVLFLRATAADTGTGFLDAPKEKDITPPAPGALPAPRLVRPGRGDG